MTKYFLGAAALALIFWPKKAAAAPAKYEGPDIDRDTGSALGTFAPEPGCDVVNVAGAYEVHCWPGRKGQP